MKTYELAQNAFQGDAPARITLPDRWNVKVCPLPCDSWPALTAEEIRDRISHPFGSPSIPELVQAKAAEKTPEELQVCIAFDDITRGTPVRPMAEAVLTELLQAGIRQENVRFLCALGAHGAHDFNDHRAKLGPEIVRRYRIYNHNCYENCIPVGTTRRGVEVRLNKEFLSCDIRIGLGAVVPHTMNAFGGGSKMIVPGIASIDTIAHNHKTATDFITEHHLNSSEMTGRLEMSGMREEIEEMARMAGQFFKIDCIYNSRFEIVGLFAGDCVEEYYQAVPLAQKAYGFPRPQPADIVIVNVNAKATEATIATGLGAMVLKDGGDVVVIDLTSRGQATHYLFGSFGTYSNGRMLGGMPTVRSNVDRYLCWMPYPDLGAAHWFGEIEKQQYLSTWEEVQRLLEDKYPGGADVTIITEGTLAYFT
jgi:nickel-dependent lactate racemase